MTNILSKIQDNKSSNSFLLLAGTLVFVLFLYLFIIQPSILRVTEIRKEIDDNTIYIQEQKSKLTTLEKVRADIAQYASQVDFFNNLITVKTDTANLVADISSIAKKNNVQFDTVTFAEKTNKLAGYATLELQLDSKSNLNDILNLMKNLESYPRPIKFVNLNFLTDTSTGISMYRVTLETYFLKPTT